MADYTGSKSGLGEIFPENTVDTAWFDGEPLLTPRKLKKLFLFGIDLISNIKSVATGKREALDDDDLKDFILEAASMAELESKIDIFPRQIDEDIAYDKNLLDSWGYIQLRHRPVASIETLQIVPSNDVPILTINNQWIDTGLLHQGQINIMPFSTLLNGSSTNPSLLATPASGKAFATLFGASRWIPSFFRCKYTAGFKDAKVPRVVNQLIGTIAAMEILSLLATTFARSNSSSLSIDGLSQSLSSPGPNVYMQRLEELGGKRKFLIGKLQAAFNMKFLMDNV